MSPAGGRLLARRAGSSAVALLAATVVIFGMDRALRPENYPGERFWPGFTGELRRVLLHFDLGEALLPAHPAIAHLWAQGRGADLLLLGGAFVLGAVGGSLTGVWCGRHAGRLRDRVVETAASVLLCVPVYVSALGLLLLFNQDIGRLVRIPWLFDVDPRAFDAPLTHPWELLHGYALPWLVLAAPLWAVCVRATARMTIEELGTDHVRTAIAKGVREARVLRRHAAPPAYATASQAVWGFVPLFVINGMLVEELCNVPGFLRRLRPAAAADRVTETLDVPMIQAISLWTVVLVVALAFVCDLVLAAIDPRARTSATGAGS